MWNKETGEGILVAGQDQAVIDADFVDWRVTIPTLPKKTAPTTFAFTELKKFEKVRPSGSKNAALRVYATATNRAAIVLTAREDFLGVIMPFAAVMEDRMPSWMPQPPPSASPSEEDLAAQMATVRERGEVGDATTH
jgi:hypothetical protein